MAIATLDQLIAAAKQRITLQKTASRTTIANAWFSVFELAGNPGAGTLAGTSTTTGVVPDDTIAGFPSINTFGGGAVGQLLNVDFGNTVACRVRVYDLLWKGGAYAFNAAVSGQTPASFLGRIPGGTNADTAGVTEIWVETVTAATGNQTWNVTYNNEAGTTGRTTGAVGIGAAPTLGRCWQLPLQAGDRGVSGITGVAGGTGSAGTANILVLRPLWTGRMKAANDGDLHDYLRTGQPRVFDTSALVMLINADSTSSGLPELDITIGNG
jgi:hypothetical protein